MSETDSEVAFGFKVRALRLTKLAQDATDAQLSLQLGIRLARLVAEAPTGTRALIHTRAEGNHLRMSVWAELTDEQWEFRSGLDRPELVVRDLAEQLAGFVSEYAEISDVEPFQSTLPGPAAPVLPLRPRATLSDTVAAGFLGRTPQIEAVWANPRPADPHAFARLLMAYPHVSMLQTVEPLTEPEIRKARADLSDDLMATDPREVSEIIGSPVRASAMLIADGPPWTIPLQLRENLRGWFHVIDLDETTAADVFGGEIMPEALAGGVLRIPATSITSFPGLPVAPKVVPLSATIETDGGVRVGVATGLRREQIDVALNDEAMSRHVHVIGETGSGKSTVLTAAAIEIAANGGGLLLLDPHGTTVNRVLGELPPETRDRVLLVRCGDSKNPVRLNPFSIGDEELQDVVISDMLEAFQQLYDPRHEGIVGPRFQHVMRNALLTLVAASGQRASLLDVPRLMYDRKFRQYAKGFVKDRDVLQFWENDFDRNRSDDLNEVIGWISSKFSAFASNRAVQAMLATGADSFDPAQAMASQRIVLIDLDIGTVGKMGARTIGLLYLLRFWVAALNRDEPDPFTILVDEASSFSAVSLPAILSEGRKFGLRALIAHQFMDQLDPTLKDAIEGSVGTRLVFRVGMDDAKALWATMHPEFGAEDLLAMPQFVAAARIADSGSPIRPFTLTVDHNQRVERQPDAKEAIAEMEAASIRELVDRHRDAHRLEDTKLESKGESSRLGKTSDGPDVIALGEARKGQESRGGFLDEWLAKRKREALSEKPNGAGLEEDHSQGRQEQEERQEHQKRRESLSVLLREMKALQTRRVVEQSG